MNDVPGLLRRHTAQGERLSHLSREHDRLSREIRQKHQRLLEVRALRSEEESRVATELEPLQRRVAALVALIRDLFGHAFDGETELSRGVKAAVRQCYVDFETDFAWLEQAPLRAGGARVNHAAPKASAHKPNPERERSLHTVFRRLVVALHPDKVQTDEEKEARTALFKQVTHAYETLDLARLLELERVHLVQVPTREDAHYLSRRINELTASNTELRRQLKSTSRQVRQARAGLIDASEPDTSRAGEVANGKVSQLIAMWSGLVERLELTRHLLEELKRGNTSALGFLDGSWRAALVSEDKGMPAPNGRTARIAPQQVDESNVESVLDAFKALRQNARKKRT